MYLINCFLKILILLCVVLFQKAHSQSSEVDDLIYYEIGGASAYSRPLGYTTYDVLDIDLKANVSLSCNGFDLEENIEALVEEFSNLDDTISNIITSYANSIVSSLPLLILREVNPNLADLLENLLARYEELVRISIADCKQIQDIISESDSFYSGWVKIFKGARWNEGIEKGDTATETQEAVDEGADIAWIDGDLAGVTENIKVIEDLTSFGYNSLLSSNSGETSPMKTIFPSEDDAIKYANRVVGELVINFKDGNSSAPGAGVLPEVMTTEKEKIIELNRLINNENTNLEQLDSASSSYIKIRGSVIEALRNQPKGVREFYTQKLASELAVSIEYEKLSALRRILVNAKREPNVLNTPTVSFINKEVLPDIDYELSVLLKQTQINNSFVSNTSQKLLIDQALKREQNQQSYKLKEERKSKEGFQLKK